MLVLFKKNIKYNLYYNVSLFIIEINKVYANVSCLKTTRNILSQFTF